MGVFKDLTGQTFGKLKVIERDLTYPIEHHLSPKNGAYWKCQCSCGNPNTITVVGSSLKKGNTKTCGQCNNYEILRQKIFGSWQVQSIDENKKGYFICQCLKCNKTVRSVRGTHLKAGTSTSCGCSNQLDKQEKLFKEQKIVKYEDLTGQIFGELTVVQFLYSKNGHAYWECDCSCQKKGIVKSARSLKTNNHPSCGHYKPLLAPQAKDLTGQVFNQLKVLYPQPRRASNGNVIWHCLCLNCNTETDVATKHLGSQISCGCLNSKGEYFIKSLLNENNIYFIDQYSFADLVGKNNNVLKYDFYLPGYNRLIEFDGEQHFNNLSNDFWYHDNDFDKRQQYDQLKNEYALSHNIDLVRIPYWERDNITLDMILGNQYLLSNKTKGNKLYETMGLDKESQTKSPSA